MILPFLLPSEPLKVGKEKSSVHVRVMLLLDPESTLLPHRPLWLVKCAEGQTQVETESLILEFH